MLFIYFLISILVTTCMFRFLINSDSVNHYLDLYDYPNNRKIHDKKINEHHKRINENQKKINNNDKKNNNNHKKINENHKKINETNIEDFSHFI